MILHQQLKEQIKDAMKARETVRLSVLRGLVANCTNELVSLKRKPTDELTDEEVLNVIRRAVKQRRDSIEQFTKGGRMDLVNNEKAELAILETYLPQMMSEEEVMNFAQAKMKELGIEQNGSTGSPQAKTGMLMGALMKKLRGKADGNTVKKVVNILLS